jgi:hypothetical protein
MKETGLGLLELAKMEQGSLILLNVYYKFHLSYNKTN